MRARTLTLTIGDPHRCNCGSAEPCCAHVRWVLERILRLTGPEARSRGLSAERLARALERAPRNDAERQPRRAAPAAPPPRRGPPIDADSAEWLLNLSGEDAWLLAQPSMRSPGGSCHSRS